MAFLFNRYRYSKKHFFIAWFDLSKGSGNAGRCDVSCKKYGAVNGEQRKILLKQFQDRENKIAFEIENNLFQPKPTSNTKTINNLAKTYLEKLLHRQELRKTAGGSAGISKSYFLSMQYAIERVFLKYCKENKVSNIPELDLQFFADFRNHLELQQETKSIASINTYLRNIRTFLNDFKYSRPRIFEDLPEIMQILKNFRETEYLPFHFATDELRKIIIKAREFDEETCKITRESKKAGKSFKNDMPVKNVPIMPMVLLIMLTGMRRSDAIALKWSNVNLETGLIKYQAIKNGKICIVPLVGDPNGDISPEFVKILKKWRKERPSDLYVLPHPLSEKPTELKYTVKRFKKKLSGITDNFTWQNLRKNFESYAVSFGIPPAITAFWVGHSPAVAEKHYMSYAIGKLNAKNIASAMGISDLI